ncbi:MAG TPA: tetratricopeptide repeat protein, partial [Candidatus Polarisedimenticolia bacterium]|nr:tetratricopeptide repeat protein [Candidatus Polarisedimenticolia bacterium]
TVARQLGEVLSARGSWGEAHVVLEKALPGLPDDPSLLIDLGFLRMMSGDRNGARAALERAVSLRPADWGIRRSLALIYEAGGQPALAAEALATVPPEAATPRLLGHLAQLYLRLDRYREAEVVFGSLSALDPEHEVLAQHGRTWCRIKRRDWRGALDVALTATRLDRLDLTTAFLAYAKDRLFTRVPDSEQREAELAERFLAELQEHDELHGDEPETLAGPAGPEREAEP